MSKAFTKEDAWDEPIIPPRAPLPAGVPNYVTPRGLALLRTELAELEAERSAWTPPTATRPSGGGAWRSPPDV